MDLKTLSVDTKKQTDGVWIQHDEKTSFLIARMANPRFQERFQKMLQPYKQKFDAGKLSSEKQVEIMCVCMSETILLGWEGLHDNGKDIPYSKEKAYEILIAEGNDEFRDLILSYAQDNEQFRRNKLEASIKNLKTG